MNVILATEYLDKRHFFRLENPPCCVTAVEVGTPAWCWFPKAFRAFCTVPAWETVCMTTGPWGLRYCCPGADTIWRTLPAVEDFKTRQGGESGKELVFSSRIYYCCKLIITASNDVKFYQTRSWHQSAKKEGNTQVFIAEEEFHVIRVSF